MNDIIPAKNYSLHKHRFGAIQKKIKYKNLYLIQITKMYPNNIVSVIHIQYVLIYLYIQK